MIFSKGERDGLPVPGPPQLLRPGRRRQEHNPPSDYHKGIAKIYGHTAACFLRFLLYLDSGHHSNLLFFVLRSISVFHTFFLLLFPS